ncbi:replication-relaxation family protein [Rudaeicoccus suwonensis]|uniref:replication-relaxation family protein n=1 Tax=Rudaeicoccus suwonensis TaxID=657409 RepID=UPI001477528C|nr:replication-relaxation family protein [Rudaeicoccus suwonensis]
MGTHRFLSTHQVQQFCFPTSNELRLDSAARVTRRALLRLRLSGVVQPVTPRRVGGIEAGSGVQLWQLTSAGHRHAAELQPPGWRYRSGSQPSSRFVAHELAMADAHLAAMTAATAMNAALQVRIEKHATRLYTGLGGTALRLIPDLELRFAGHDTEGSYDDHWFVEVDMGSESLPTLLRKCEQYEAYYRSGTEQSTNGVFPLIVWVLHGPRAQQRKDELIKRITTLAARGQLTSQIHRVATTEQQLHQLLVTGGAT